PASGPAEPQKMEAFEVTDSKVDGLNNKTIFRTDEKAPLPFSVITRDEIDHMGATNIQEVFRAIPQITNYGFSTQANATMINVSLRKDYNAKETTTYYGTSTEGGGAEYHLTYLQGLTFNQGKDHLTLTADYLHRNAIKGYERDYYKRALAKYPRDTKLVTST